jgi:hypothetical protein
MTKRPVEEPKQWLGWKFYSARDATGKAKCLVTDGAGICGAELTYSTTTHNFKKHLERKHKQIFMALEAEELDAHPAPALVLPSRTQPSISDYYDPLKIKESITANSHLIKRLEREVVRFIAGDLRPFSAVEGLLSSSHHVLLTLCKDWASRV